jgi:hypothetical protein
MYSFAKKNSDHIFLKKRGKKNVKKKKKASYRPRVKRENSPLYNPHFMDVVCVSTHNHKIRYWTSTLSNRPIFTPLGGFWGGFWGGTVLAILAGTILVGPICQPPRPRGGISSCYWCQVVLSNCWMLIFDVLPKLDGCQAKIANCCSCSNSVSTRQIRVHWDCRLW